MTAICLRQYHGLVSRSTSIRTQPSRWIKRVGVGCLIALGVSAAGWSSAQSSAPSAGTERTVTEWLTRMHDASRRRAYIGTLVVSAGSSMSASRIWHVCDGNQQMERVDTLTGAPRTTVRHNNEVITFAPDSKTAWVEKRESLGLFPDLLRTPDNLIPDFYTVQATGLERVAGHKADVLEIRARDKLRFGYRIWSEKDTGLVVKLQTLDGHGQVLEQVAFTELQLDAPVSMDKLSKFMKSTRGYEVHRPVLRKTTPEAEGWRLKELVPGFQSMSCHTRESADASGVTSHPMQWVFSDGLASVSLFVEPYNEQQHLEEKASVIGATHSLTRRLGQHWVTALGEVPHTTLLLFAKSLEYTR
ncbi:MAG: transcriptional regulator [Comamonadaceae bacterium]|nr:transcriptional regulator [Comamonadaceae bacterium]